MPAQDQDIPTRDTTSSPPATASPTISAVIISCNEADVIEPCLQSITSWVDEIVLVDMHSTDGTREIARRYGARLIDHERLTDADPARSFALAQATCDWIIMLDPDERVLPSLAGELRRLAASRNTDVVLIPFQQVMFGKVVQSTGASDGPHPRFFRRGIIVWPPGIHAWPDLTGLRSYTIASRSSDLAILHDTWRSAGIVLDKIIRYAPKDAELMRANGEHFSLARMLRVTLGGFGNRMADGRAYEDGMAGLLTALYWAIYDLTIQVELWDAEGKPAVYDQQIKRWGARLAPLYRSARAIRRGIGFLNRITRSRHGPHTLHFVPARDSAPADTSLRP